MTVTGITLASQLRILLLIDEMIDPEFSTYSELTHLNTYFPEKNTALLIIHPQKGVESLSKASICDIRHWVQQLAIQQKNLSEVVSSFGAKTIEFKDNELRPKTLLLPDCAKMEEPEIKKISAGLQSIKASPWSTVLSSPAANDIAFEFHFRETVPEKYWLYPTQQKKFASMTVLEVKKNFEELVEKTHPDIKSTWGGVAAFQAYYKLAYDQANLLNILSLVIVFALMKFLFGTFRAGILYIISLITAVAPVFGGMALAGTPVDVLTNSIGLMIMIAALEDFLFVGFFIQKHRGSWKKSFRRFLIPSFFTTLTTFVGFGSLAVADLAILRRFGLWAAAGSLFQFITVYYLLPAIMQIFPWFQKGFCKQNLQWHWLEVAKNFRLPAWFGRGTALIFILSLLGIGHIKVTDAPTNIFPHDHPANVAARELLELRGWQTNLSLVFKNPEAKDFNQKIIDGLKAQAGVVGVENTYEIKSYLTKDIPDIYLSTIDQLWSMSSSSHRLHSEDTNEDRAIVYIATQDIENTNRLYNWVKQQCQGQCFLAGSIASYSEFGQRVLSALMSSLFTSLILVSLILILLCLAKDVKFKIPVILSATWGPLAMIFFFIVFQVPIFYITSMFASILIGLAGDNSIQFIFSKTKDSPLEGVKSLGSSAILIVLSMCALTSVLFLSHFAALQKLGALMICGFVLMLFGDIAILRSLASTDSSSTRD